MSNHKFRHLILEDIFQSLSYNSVPLDYAVEIEILTKNEKDVERVKALKYLISSGYLKYVHYDGKYNTVLLQQKDIEAYHSEYFLEAHKDHVSKITERRVMIWCNIVVALGVIVTLWKDIFKEKENIVVQLPQQTQTLQIAEKDAVLPQIKTFLLMPDSLK